MFRLLYCSPNEPIQAWEKQNHTENDLFEKNSFVDWKLHLKLVIFVQAGDWDAAQIQ